MTDSPVRKDLVVLAADKNLEFAVGGLLTRSAALGVRKISADIYVHPESDPGCLLRAPEFLRPLYRQYGHAMVLLDREGCGQEDQPREVLETGLEDRLARLGWSGRAAAVVLDPELEIWVWSDSPEVDRVLGWLGRQPSLREWLRDRRYQMPGSPKPRQPKEALHEALRIVRKHRSSAIYRELAQSVSVERCVDAAFIKLRQTLQRWFGTGGATSAAEETAPRRRL